MFQSELHEKNFKKFLDIATTKSEYFSDDKFFRSMLYILTSDSFFKKSEQIFSMENGKFKIKPEKLEDVFLSSTEKFMMKFALSTYFTLPLDYKFQTWYYQLDSRNQALIENALKFLQH